MFERMYTNDLPRTYTSSTKKAEVANPTANETTNGPPSVLSWRNLLKWLIPSTARHTQDVFLNTRAALNSVVEHSEDERPKEEPSDELSQIAKYFAIKVPDGIFS
jgi:hypothetical protein